MPPSTDDDNNPFGRPSAWPKMPQAPFRIGPLPKAGAPAPAPAPPAPPPSPAGLIATPQPRLETGAPGFFSSGPMGGVQHGAAFLPGAAQPAPPAEPEPTPERFLTAPMPGARASQAPPAAERPPIQVAEVEVVGRRRTPEPELDDFDEPAEPLFIPQAGEVRRPRSRTPLVAVGVVAVIGLGGLGAWYGTRKPAPAPSAATPVAPPSPAPEQATAIAPAVSAPSTASPSAAEPIAAPTPPPAPAAPRPTVKVASAARRAAPTATAVEIPATAPVAAAAPEAAPPTVVVPPPAPVVAAPSEPPAPPRKAPPSDPSAPIPTKPTYSE